MKRLSVLLLIVVISSQHSFANAGIGGIGDYIKVQICNKGNTLLYVTYAEVTGGGGLLVPASFKLSGWYHVSVGECQFIGSDRPELRFIGFAMTNSAGEFGMVHETYSYYTPGVEDTDRTYCVDPVNAFTLNGTTVDLQQCSEGFVPARFSLKVYPKFRTTLTIDARPDASNNVDILSVEGYKEKQKAEQMAKLKAEEERKQKAKLEELRLKEEMEQLTMGAKQGNTIAQYFLGSVYFLGRGLAQNYTEAMKWYRKAADQGYAEAQVAVGFMYSDGRGVPKDEKEAVKWYRKAAEQGYAEGQFNLGFKYDHGEGVPQNFEEAIKWYRLAAKQGYADAQKVLADPMHDIDARRWMTQCEKEFYPIAGLTKQEHFVWCQCQIKAMLPIKAQFSKTTKDELATFYRKGIKEVWDKIQDESYRCYKAN